MKLGKLLTLFGLIAMMSGLCRAELLPGDIALTRIQGNVISLMALRAIPDGETFRVTDSNWVNGSFDGSGNGGVVAVPPGGLQPGDQFLIDLSNFNIELVWKKTLHFFQIVTPAHTPESHLRHLLLVELDQEGLRWQTNIPDGLIRDVTHITIRQQFEGQGMDHIIKEGFLSTALTPYQWMRALGSFRSWTFSEDYNTPLSLSQWLEVKMTVNPSPGIISLPYRAQNYPEQDGQIYVPVRRSFGTAGVATPVVAATDKIGPFKRWQNLTDGRFNMDFTDVAYGTGVGFVAIAPQSGLIFVNEGNQWTPRETNQTPGENLQLSGIIHDGEAFYSCSLRGHIYKSGDGINWAMVREGRTGEQLLRMHHLGGAEFPLVAVGANGLALFSIDGSNWLQAEIPGAPNLYGATFFDGRFVLCGSGGNIVHTNSPNGTWQPATTPDNRSLYSIATVNVGGVPTLLAVGEFGAMISTANLENNFIARQSNTNQSLFDIIGVSRDGGANQYVFVVGASGTTVLSANDSGFNTSRFDPRAPALYALAQDPSGKDAGVHAVGEYGSLIRFNPDGATLSGSLSGVDLEGEATSVTLLWGNGQSGEKYVKLTKGAALGDFRERIDLELRRHINSANYRLGNAHSQINFFRSPDGNPPPVVDNFGPLLNLTGAGLEVLNEEEWRLRFRIFNSSRRSSKRLFIRFEGTNLPDFDLPDGDTQGQGSTLAPLERTGFITTILRQPVESIALYEEFRSGEEVLKAQTAINSLVANPNWTPNGIFPRSLGAYLQDASGLPDPGIPGVGILGGGQGSPPAKTASPTTASAPVAKAGSGFVFSGTAPTPPENNPESSELVLLAVNIGGPTGMNVNASYNFFLSGDFYNTGTGLSEQYSMNTIDWAVTESSSPAVGLSIEDDTGAFEATAYPGVAYPRSVSIDASTTEGAPLDAGGRAVPYSDSQGLQINEPSSFRTYAEWVTANSLTGDDALEGQDSDGDGIVNLLEYALGTDPSTANAMSGVSSSLDPDTGMLTFCFTVPKDLSAVMMKVETSTNLSTWTERTMSLDSSDSTTETWCVSVNLGATGFARLRVETYTP